MQNAEFWCLLRKRFEIMPEGHTFILHFALCILHSSQVWVVFLLIPQLAGAAVAGEDPEVGFDGGQALQGSLDGLPVTAGQVGAATGAGKKGVAGDQGVPDQQAHGAGGVAGGVENPDGQTSSSSIKRLILRTAS